MKVKCKRWLPVFAAGAMLAAAPVPSYGAGWTLDGVRVTYEQEDGSRVRDTWMEYEGKWFHFDRDGYVQAGWYKDPQGRRFWLGPDGVMAADTVRLLDGKVYVIDENGYCTEQKDYTGWIQDGAGRWFRNKDGTWPKAGWLALDGEWYDFDENGYARTGWLEENGIRYYLDGQGRMLHDEEQIIDGITYRFDSSGAGAPAVKTPVVIPPDDQKTELERTVDAMADQVLARIVTPGMNDHQKATAIYNWVRGNFTYSASGSMGHWPTAAYEGFRRRRGNCFTYYSVSLALLSRVGIPSIEVIRETDNGHWWNMVYVDGVWLHFDATPRRLGGNFCLLTTDQLLAYSNTHGASHVFDPSKYPATP